MKLRFTPRATQDLIDIADYIRERNPVASLRVRAAILDSLKHLPVFPGDRSAADSARGPQALTRKYPYFVYYRFDRANEEIVILTIRHPSRRRQYEDA